MSERANPADDDPIGDAAEDSTRDWQDLIDPVTVPIEQLVDRSKSLAEIRDGLAGLVPQLDVGAVREKLALATFSARLGGDAAIGREMESSAAAPTSPTRAAG